MSDLRAGGSLERITALHLVLILILGFLAYSNTLGVPFVLDDVPNIVENPLIKDFSYFFGEPKKADVDPVVRWLFKSRTVGYFSFALNYVSHGLDLRGFHATNIAIHIINAMLVYWLVVLTFSTPALARTKFFYNPRHIALFSALLFVSHPVQTQAVTYIIQRFASLAAFFYLLSLALYIKCRLSNALTPKSVSIYVLALLSAVLAMKTKEIAFTLPFAVALYEFVFFKGSLRKRLLYILPLFLSSLIIPISLLTTDMPPEGITGSAGGALRLETEMPRSDYLFTQFRVISTYIRLLIFPINQALDYDYPEFHALLDPQVLSSILFLLSVFGLGLYLLRRSRTSEPALGIISFGIFWFFIALSVESSVVPIADVIFEHRVYLPGAGVFTAAATGAFLALEKLKNKDYRIVGIALLASVVLVLSAATYARNAVWKSDISLWQDIVGKAPENARGQYNLGVAYESKGMYAEAMRQYGIAVNLHTKQGTVLEKQGNLNGAITQYKLAVEISPYFADGQYNLANAYMLRGLTEKAIEHYEYAVRLKADPGYHTKLALAYEKMGLDVKAQEHFRLSEDLKRKAESANK